MPKLKLTEAQLRTAISKCHAQLGHLLDQVQVSQPGNATIGQENRALFHDIVVHALGLLTHPSTRSGGYRTLITQAYANSVHLKEAAPRRDSVRAIMAVLAAVGAALAADDAISRDMAGDRAS